MYDRRTYEELGGFVESTLFNEDMIYAGHLVQAGYAIAYAADAKVVHSHNYSAIQQFHRNFDLAVSQADHPEVFGGLPSEGEGMRLVRTTAGWLLKNGNGICFRSLCSKADLNILDIGWEKHIKKLPVRLIKKLTMNQSYWE